MHVRSFSNVGPMPETWALYTQFPVYFLDCGDKNYPGRIHSQLIALRYSDVSYGAIVETSETSILIGFCTIFRPWQVPFAIHKSL